MVAVFNSTFIVTHRFFDKKETIMKSQIISIIAALVISTNVIAQNFSVFKISPQHFLENSMKVEWEIGTSPTSSFIVSPKITVYDQEDEKVLGGGIEFGRRYYIFNKDSLKLNGFYAQISLQYNYYDTKYTDRIFYYGSGYYNKPDSSIAKTYNESIHQIAGDFIFGYQVSVKNIFYVDMFLGGGMKMGISILGSDSYYRDSFLGYSYNGVVPKAGIKIGMKI
jgi:hypothetical protein